MSEFLGTPGVGNLRGDQPFPAAARTALAADEGAGGDQDGGVDGEDRERTPATTTAGARDG